MIHTLVGPRSRRLKTQGVAHVTRGIKAVRRRLPVTRSPTGVMTVVQRRDDRETQPSLTTTLEVVATPAPRRR